MLASLSDPHPLHSTILCGSYDDGVVLFFLLTLHMQTYMYMYTG